MLDKFGFPLLMTYLILSYVIGFLRIWRATFLILMEDGAWFLLLHVSAFGEIEMTSFFPTFLSQPQILFKDFIRKLISMAHYNLWRFFLPLLLLFFKMLVEFDSKFVVNLLKFGCLFFHRYAQLVDLILAKASSYHDIPWNHVFR